MQQFNATTEINIKFKQTWGEPFVYYKTINNIIYHRIPRLTY